jgi:hypothetical protein
MNSRRLYWTLVALCWLALLALLGGTYELNNMLKSRAVTLTKERQQIAIMDAQETSLKKAKADIQKYQQLAATAKSIVPQDKDQAQTVREIVKLANQNGVDLGGFLFPASTLGATAPVLPSTSTSTGSTTPSSAVTHKATQSQLTPVPGIPGVQSLQIIVNSDSQNTAPYSAFLSFLEALEQNRRTALVTSVTITPDPKVDGFISFTLTLEEYIKS